MIKTQRSQSALAKKSVGFHEQVINDYATKTAENRSSQSQLIVEGTKNAVVLTRCESAISNITIYDKQNKILRPMLRNYRNVEQKVSTQRLRDSTY